MTNEQRKALLVACLSHMVRLGFRKPDDFDVNRAAGAWASMLSELTAEEIQAGFRGYARHSRFWPLPSEILAHVKHREEAEAARKRLLDGWPPDHIAGVIIAELGADIVHNRTAFESAYRAMAGAWAEQKPEERLITDMYKAPSGRYYTRQRVHPEVVTRLQVVCRQLELGAPKVLQLEDTSQGMSLEQYVEQADDEHAAKAVALFASMGMVQG